MINKFYFCIIDNHYKIINKMGKNNSGSKTLYVLRLENNKYYVGVTERDINERINEHRARLGAEWTKQYPVLDIVEVLNNADPELEDKYVKKYMMDYGIDNVRGGSYLRMELPSYQIESLNDEFKTLLNKCFKCNQVGHFLKECPLYKTGEKPGDWYCCNHLNFGSRNECQKCGKPKNGSAIDKETSAMKPGDWICADCNEHNFASRKKCRQCGRRQANEGTLAKKQNIEQTSEMKPGDWICSGCREHNFASRTHCFKCGSDKNWSSYVTPSPSPSSVSSIKLHFDWTCRNCHRYNFASKSVCFKCGRPPTTKL